MKRLLFNATHPEELRVAIVNGQKLLDLDIESAIRSERKGNIYKAVVTKVEPSLEAAFVDYGAGKHGFLSLKEICRNYFRNYDGHQSISQIRIEDAIKAGQEMIVQVEKDERGTKGASLTTFISLAGRFLVLMPNNPKGGGISRRISGGDRTDLRDTLANLDIPSEHALIARTAGIGRSREELQWDLDFLGKLWQSIENASKAAKAPFLIYQESNLIVRSIRDHLSADIAEIIIDDEEIYERAERFMSQVMPQNLARLKLYQSQVPLFSRFHIERQIESAFTREVKLPSGGSIVIDHTEALIAVDVNSGRSTKGGDIEETAFQTNFEAVGEVARQLRLRDLGGLIVIDLIDMSSGENQRLVENRLKEALKSDRARVQIGKISRFGLLEMSRQRLRASISDANYIPCPRCQGTGSIRSVVSSSLNVLRLIEDAAKKENTEALQVDLPLDMATYLMNEKRHELHQLEARLASRIIVIPNERLDSPDFTLRKLRGAELENLGQAPSYEQKIDQQKNEPDPKENLKSPTPPKASVELDSIQHTPPPLPSAPATPESAHPSRRKRVPEPANPAKPISFLRRITQSLFGTVPTETGTSGPDHDTPSRKSASGRRKGNATGRRDTEKSVGGRRRQTGKTDSRGERSQHGRNTDHPRAQAPRRDSDKNERKSPGQKPSRTPGAERGGGRRRSAAAINGDTKPNAAPPKKRSAGGSGNRGKEVAPAKQQPPISEKPRPPRKQQPAATQPTTENPSESGVKRAPSRVAKSNHRQNKEPAMNKQDSPSGRQSSRPPTSPSGRKQPPSSSSSKTESTLSSPGPGTVLANPKPAGSGKNVKESPVQSRPTDSTPPADEPIRSRPAIQSPDLDIPLRSSQTPDHRNPNPE